MSDHETKALQLLFQRPLEPVFTSRDNGTTAFDLPDTYYTDRYSTVAAADLQFRFGDKIETKIPIRDVTKPDLSFAKDLGRKQQFSLFNDKHKKIASQLIKLFMDATDVSQFTGLAAYTMDRVNAMLFQYAYSVAIEHRPDTRHIQVPPVAEQFPKNFVEPSVFNDARAEAALISNENRMVLEIQPNFTASDREEEQRLAYFREDIGVNSHHWHWHLVYPTEGPDEVVNKDRRGELFYFMHHQILARYNCERFCNQLAKLKPLNNLRDPIPEGYFPKILSSLNNRTYPSRATNVKLQDINRADNQIEIADVQRWADRIHQAIDQGYVTDSTGQNIPLDPIMGIDILGNLIERSQLSINPQLYGNLHNMGHNLISLSHDPDSRHLEEFGVMGDVSTAMRDPVFYRWHGYIDSIFNKFKNLLPYYTDEELLFKDIVVNSVNVQINARNSKPNILLTYWQKSDVDLAAGLDFGPNGNIYAHFTHLQHAPFEYTIMATNGSSAQRQGTCRLFLCPKSDERGTALSFNEQRDLTVEMDKFTVILKPGQNIIKRRSDQSSVTIPYERSYRRLGVAYQPTDAEELKRFQFCGCGWPQHLLIPKGNAAGIKFDIFCMISDYTNDVVEQPDTKNAMDPCGDSYSFCGLKDKSYPDKRAMGYPFDRRSVADTLDTFTNAFNNMSKQEISIKFNNIIVDK